MLALVRRQTPSQKGCGDTVGKKFRNVLFRNQNKRSDPLQDLMREKVPPAHKKGDIFMEVKDNF